MTRRNAADMPEQIRHLVRAKHHPARAVECPHCGAHPHRPCTTPNKRRLMPEPHPKRITAWVTSIAVCPTCQVAPGTACHEAGQALHDGAVHVLRQTEAEETAA